MRNMPGKASITSHLFLELDGLVHLPWEAIDQEPLLAPTATRRIQSTRRNLLRPAATTHCAIFSSMALRSNLMVTSMGTMVPFLMFSLIIAPYVDPSRFCSARNKSPARRTKHVTPEFLDDKVSRIVDSPERWANWKSSTSLAHWVPFPVYRRDANRTTFHLAI